MNLPTVRLLFTLVVIASAAAACGKKGPPLAPFARVPTRVENLVPTRIGDDILLSFPVPSANVDGRKPADLGKLEIYAITATRKPETPEERKVAPLIATLNVRPVLPPPPDDAPAGTAEAMEKALAPGLDQGATAVFSETLTDELRVPVELPKRKNRIEPLPVVELDEPLIGPLVAPPETETARRYYFVVPVSPGGREGPPSDAVSVPFGDTSAAPGTPTVEYTATQMTLTWDPPPNARTWSIAPVLPPVPPPPKPVAPADEPPDPAQPATPAKPVPPPPPAAPLLTVKPLGFNTQATLYQVYEVPSAAATSVPTTPAAGTPASNASAANAVTIPKPLTPQPIDKNEFVLRSFAFGVERCFYVRPVDVIFGMSVQGPASPQTCVAPVDTFAPQAPRALAAIAGGGVINLIWDANTESDLAGYIVLRGEAPGDRLLPLTSAPIRETTFRDTTVQPAVRYVYAVVAVDSATPPNRSPESARTEETARQ